MNVVFKTAHQSFCPRLIQYWRDRDLALFPAEGLGTEVLSLVHVAHAHWTHKLNLSVDCTTWIKETTPFDYFSVQLLSVVEGLWRFPTLCHPD